MPDFDTHSKSDCFAYSNTFVLPYPPTPISGNRERRTIRWRLWLRINRSDMPNQKYGKKSQTFKEYGNISSNNY